MQDKDLPSYRFASYPRGVNAHARKCAMTHQLALLAKAVAPWPRRQAPLLEINCGNGVLLPFFWQCGFDVQGVEENADLRARAAAREIAGLEVHAASDQDIPLETDSFDWVILHLKANNPVMVERAAREGVRLARRGFMVTFWNSSSLPALFWKASHKKVWSANAMPWRELNKILRKLHAGKLSSLSTLPLPAFCWQWPLARLDLCLGSIPLGAWCAIRIDMGEQYPVTPLPLRVSTAIRTPEALLEFTHKSRLRSRLFKKIIPRGKE